MFSILVDIANDLLRVKFSGFMSVQEVDAFARAEEAALVRLGCGSTGHLLLCDTTECALQSQEVAMAFRNLIVGAPRPAGRLAIVTGQSASRMQVRRILQRPDAKIFDSVSQAEVWLFADAPADTLIAPNFSRSVGYMMSGSGRRSNGQP